MISFFRTLRQRLLADNRLNGYILYAVGEIILVVIGILIALQINNWNLDRLDRKASLEYHKRIIEDLDRYIERVDALNANADRVLRSMVKTLALLEAAELPQDQENTFSESIIGFSRFNYRNPDLATLDEMKSAGDLGLIYNVGLRKRLVELQGLTESTNSIYESLGNTIQAKLPLVDRFVRYSVDTLDYRISHRADFAAMAADKEFINHFSRISVHWRASAFFSRQLREEAREVKDLFEEEVTQMEP